MKKHKYAFIYAIIAALGGFLFGFDTAVISGTTSSLERVYELSDFWLGFTVAVALIGTIIGSVIFGKPADIFGRKKVLITLAVLYALSAIGSALAFNWMFFLFSRIIGGLAVGGASVITPMYIAEISPAHLRGRLVAISQFNIVIGILTAFFSNFLLSGMGEIAWRWMLGVETFPALLFFSTLFIIPNSPRWLVKQQRVKEAEAVLIKIGETNIKAKINDIVESLRSETGKIQEKLFCRKYRFSILAAVMVALFNQLSGINVIMYYAPKILEMTGLAFDTALLQSVAIGFTNMLFTILAMFMIDRVGRKTLLLIGSVGMSIFLALVAYSFYKENFDGYSVLLYLVGYCAFFAFSQGAVIWVFLSEIFPNKVRAKGQALGSFTHWAMAAMITWIFPVMANSRLVGGGNSFMFFSVMMLLQFFFVWKILPETKGKTLEQIQKEVESK